MHLTKAEISIGIMNGKISSTINDTGATSNAGLQAAPIIITNKDSSKVFHLPTGTTEQVTKVAKLEHEVQEPAQTVDMVPDLVQHTVLSVRKFANAECILIYDVDEVNIYDGQNAEI